MKRLCIALLAAAAVTSGACVITTETTHTLYLESDGSVTWTVLERDARSDSDDPARRERDESEWLTELEAGEHPVALALARLGAASVETELLRRQRPYTARTEASFAAIDALIWEIGNGLCTELRSSLESRGSTYRLEIEIDLPEDEPECEEASLLMPLWDAFDGLALRLSRGRFSEARGFTLDQNGTRAVVDELADESGIVRMLLVWEEEV